MTEPDSDAAIVVARRAARAVDEHGQLERADSTGFSAVWARLLRVAEQSLALANISRMLDSGGVLLTNNPLFELPAVPVHQIGETKAVYTDGGSDWIAWYQRE